MKSRKNEVKGITKYLVHKLDNGRKKDSRFWNSEFDTSYNSSQPVYLSKPDGLDAEIRNRKAKRKINYLIASSLITIIILVVVKPDLFPFLKNHEIYKGVNTTLENIKKSVPNKPEFIPNKTKIVHKPRTDQNRNKLDNIISRTKSYKKYARFDNPYLNPINLKGKVFSWIDEKGKRQFSNTNFPLDNETLRVQTEINGYSKTTRIEIIGNSVYVPVTFRNKRKKIIVKMLIDTGCSVTTLPYKYLNYLEANYVSKGSSTLADGSRITSYKANIDMMVVGSKRMKNVTLSGIKYKDSNRTGLLGIDFLKYNSFRIDFDNELLVWM